jgi:hypothetical protein
MAGESKRTTDHDEIRRWIEERGGRPAVVKATEEESGEGLLRVDYPGYRGKAQLEEISWDDFFRTFDDRKLEFLYQEQTKGGKTSRFSKFVSRGNASGGPAGSRRRGSDSGSKMTRSNAASGERKSESRSSQEKSDDGKQSRARASSRRSSAQKSKAS